VARPANLLTIISDVVTDWLTVRLV